MLKSIASVALGAGEIIKRGVVSDKHVNYKGRIDLVTEFDLEVEKVLKDKLSKLFPNHEIVAEESGEAFADHSTNAIYIDPIDGTTNFVHDFPFVAISIGVYTDGVGQYGVVYNPVINELFTAEKGCGAFCNGHRISVSKTSSLEKSLVATGFPYDKSKLSEVLPILQKVLERTRGIRRAGSAALDLCYVAKGVYDLYYEKALKPWDISAGMIILREAGGESHKFDGELQDLKTDDIIGSNRFLLNEFMELIKSA